MKTINKKENNKQIRRAKKSIFFAPNTIFPKLTINQPNDKYEQEADAMAERVMTKPVLKPVQHTTQPVPQLKSEKPEEDPEILEEETPEVQREMTAIASSSDDNDENTTNANNAPNIQTKFAEDIEQKDDVQTKQEGKSLQTSRTNNASNASSGFQQQLNASSGKGSPLSSKTNEHMSSAFNADFNGVRLHTDSRADNMNESIQARAFTYGSDIFFRKGEYNPGTLEGDKLLAHELTHVVQQTPSVSRKRNETLNNINNSKSIQRSHIGSGPLTFGPTRKYPKGTAIHNRVLPLFVAANSDLFIETRIPGANKKDVDTGRTGIADFYLPKASGGEQRTIAIRMIDGHPNYMTANTRLEYGGGSYSHNKKGAPKGTTNKPRIREVDNAPIDIALGDLKPAFSAEEALGKSQLRNYKSGIENTSSELNNYALANPGQSDTSNTWKPNPSFMDDVLTIPENLRVGTTKKIYETDLALYEGTKWKKEAGLDGYLIVYKTKTTGIWGYEWMPNNVNADVGCGKVDSVLNRLNSTVVPPITGGSKTPKGKLQRKPITAINSTQKRIQRGPKKKKKSFVFKTWKTGKYDPWEKEAKKFVGDKKEVEKTQVSTALYQLNKRTKGKANIPKEVIERGKGLKKIKLWLKFGTKLGRLRERFDSLFVKIKGFTDKIKKKVKKLAKSSGGKTFSSWIKATAKVIFKIFKMVGKWVVTETIAKLITSLSQGIEKNISKLIENNKPEFLQEKIDFFESKKQEYEDLISAKEAELKKKFFGNYLDKFENLAEFEAIADKYTTIATIVEWGVRLLACAAPPAIGCLWNLVISALQAAFAMLLQTCWFSKKVYQPIINKVDMVKSFPAKLAQHIVTSANKLLPVPAGFDPFFANINLNLTQFKVECPQGGGGGGIRSEILELIEEIGVEKYKALMTLMLKRGAGPWLLLDKEKLKEIKVLLETVTINELINAAKDKPDAVESVPLQEFLKRIKKYSKAEKKLIHENREEKKLRKILEKPYPPKKKQIETLEKTINWKSIANEEYNIQKIGDDYMFFGKTTHGKRIGGYIKIADQKYRGKTYSKIINNSDFITLDRITTGDTVGIEAEILEGDSKGIKLFPLFMGTWEKYSDLELTNEFAGLIFPKFDK